MSNAPLLQGSIVALVTPMNNHGEVDFENLKQLVEYHVQAGTDAIVSVGTTGESATLSIEENVKVILKTVEFAAGRIPVIAGTGANATSEAVTMTKLLNNSGIVGCLSVVPYYNKPTQEGMYIPQILYNVPGRTGSDLLPETVGRLSAIPNIIGIKEATGDISRVQKIKQLAGKDFFVFSGDDASCLEAMKLGAEGVISVTSNVAPKAMAEMCRLARQGHFSEAETINQRLMPLHKNLFIESNPIPVKWACYKLGLIADPTLRLPLTLLSESAQPVVLDALNFAGLR